MPLAGTPLFENLKTLFFSCCWGRTDAIFRCFRNLPLVARNIAQSLFSNYFVNILRDILYRRVRRASALLFAGSHTFHVVLLLPFAVPT